MAITKIRGGQFQEPYLLFHPLTSITERAVPLRVIDDQRAFEGKQNALANEFREIGSRGVKTAAQAMDRNGNLFFVLWEPLAIVCWDSSTPYNRDNIMIVYRNDQTLQFASGMKIVEDARGQEELWLVTNRLQKFWNGNVNPNETNYRILAVNLKLLLGPFQKCLGTSLSAQQNLLFPNLLPPNNALPFN
jgi:Major royal jelly protein